MVEVVGGVVDVFGHNRKQEVGLTQHFLPKPVSQRVDTQSSRTDYQDYQNTERE